VKLFIIILLFFEILSNEFSVPAWTYIEASLCTDPRLSRLRASPLATENFANKTLNGFPLLPLAYDPSNPTNRVVERRSLDLFSATIERRAQDGPVLEISFL